jgi:ABC-type lipoprotein release transport system permease subunit
MSGGNMVLKIAFRNLIRQKRRTLLSSVTIGFALMVFIAMNSLLTGMDKGAIDNMVHLSTGALSIYTKAYKEEKQTLPLNHGIDNYREIASVLHKDNRVAGTTKRTHFMGQLSNYSETMPVIGTVIDRVSDESVFNIRENVTGSYFGDKSEHEILLGSGLAKDMGVKAGDYITLYALTKYDSRNADEFLIKGLINSTDPSLNKNGVFITFEAADNFLDLEGLVTEMDVAVSNRISENAFEKDVLAVQRTIQTQFPSMYAESFLEIGAAFFQMSKTKAAFGFVFMGIILLIAGVGIFNTVFMSVYERMREIGVLRAHGMNPGGVHLLFLLEGVITGFFGSILGVTAGAMINVYLTVKGYSLDKMANNIDTSGFPIWGTVYGVWNFKAMAFVFCFGVLIAAMASIIPARAAARLQVTKALRF